MEPRHGELGGPGGYAYRTWLPQSGNRLNRAVGGDLEIYRDEWGEREWGIRTPIR